MERGSSLSHTQVTRSPALTVLLAYTPGRHNSHAPAGGDGISGVEESKDRKGENRKGITIEQKMATRAGDKEWNGEHGKGGGMVRGEGKRSYLGG